MGVLSVARRWWVWAIAAALVVGGLVTWLAWPSEPPPPRARPYLEFTACLLTDEKGLAGAQAAPVWAGMQEASLATHAKVQYQQVMGEATVANAQPYLAGLLQRQCAVVFAVGPAQVGAVAAQASKYPGVRFVVVGGSASGANVTVVDASAPSGVQGRVKTLLIEAVPKNAR